MSRIDLDELLREISPDAPSGEEKEIGDLKRMSKPQVDEELKRKGQFGDDQEENYLTKPNWKDVQKEALKLLAETHDLKIAVILARALIDTQGLKGFCDGLTLIRGFIEQYWETVYPLLDIEDNNDPWERIRVLSELSPPKESVGSAYDTFKFIDSIKGLPLCNSKAMGKYSLRDIHIANGTLKFPATEGKELPDMNVIRAAFRDSDKEKLRDIQIATGTALEEVDGLDRLLAEKVGSGNSVPFDELTKVLKDIRKTLADQVGEEADSPEPDEDIGNTDSTAPDQSAPPCSPGRGGIANRQDVIRMLDRICDYYARNEPASPVPLLLQRARRLVEKSFIEILADMAPDSLEKVQDLFGGPPETEKES